MSFPMSLAILRKRIIVCGLVAVSGCVQPHSTLAFHNFTKLIGNDILIGGSYGLLPGFFKLSDLLVIAPNFFLPFMQISGVGVFHFFQRNFLRRPVRGANFMSALESHVL